MNIPFSSIPVAGIPCFSENSKAMKLGRITYVYGPNGTGKSSIANRLLEESNNELGVSGFLFNQKFINNLIDPRTDIDGVYHIQEGDAETIRRLKELEGNDEKEGEIKLKERLLEGLEKTVNDNQGIINDAFELLSKICWPERKNVPENIGKLIFKGLNGKVDKFTKRCLEESEQYTADGLKEARNLEELEDRLIKVSSDSTVDAIELESWPKLQELTKDHIKLLEKSFSQNGESRLADLIDQLNNRHWVKEGIGYLASANGQCPFCQESIPPSTKKELVELFDREYLEAENSIKSLRNAVQSNLDELEIFEQRVLDIEVVPIANLKKQIDQIRSYYLLLQSKVLQKGKDLGSVLRLDDLMVPEGLDFEVNLVNYQIRSLNKDRVDQASARTKISIEAWQAFLRDNIAVAVASYSGKVDSPKRALANIKSDRLPTTKHELENLRGELERCKAKLNSTRPVMNEVNGTLKGLGFSSFALEPFGDEDRFYRIVRKDGSLAGDTLSEGEKTLVSFLYFYHRVIDSSKDFTSQTLTVAIVDDPISSLDSQTLFAISLLCRRLTSICEEDSNNLSQIVYLTHNAYFHQEVTFTQRGKTEPKGRIYNLLRKEHDGTSRSESHEKNPIDSTYSLLWRAIREDAESGVMSVNTQNGMRRILESYFHMIGGLSGDLVDRFDVHEQLAARSLLSWINDGSHSIPWNADYSATILESSLYFTVFRKIFEYQDQGGHYRMMMGI